MIYKEKSTSIVDLNRNRRLLESQKDTERAFYEFLQSDECSTCLPGKKDKVTVDRNVKQKRVLTDYMTNLHNNLLADYSTKKVSFVVFCRLRPAHIKLASFPTRQTCLCQRHQNLSLKAVAIRERGVHCSSNPETFAQQSDAQIHEQLASFPQKIYFDQWQIESNVYLGKVVKKTKLAINNELEKSDFVTQVKKIIDFRSHVSREQKQYTELRNLKNKICPEHVLIQMDFAENFACSHADEVQSAYHSKPAVTLHSAVIYYLREGESELSHASYVVTTDEMQHNAFAVVSIMGRLQTEVKKLVPHCKLVTYLTDSPTSKYRNKHIFYVIANHHKMYGKYASWMHYEAGQGKSVCDGIGGASK